MYPLDITKWKTKYINCVLTPFYKHENTETHIIYEYRILRLDDGWTNDGLMMLTANILNNND